MRMRGTIRAGLPAVPVRRCAILLLCSALSPLNTQSPACAQAPVHPTARGESLFRIAGTIVNAATGEPIRRASVAALAEEDSHTIEAVESDGDGHFVLDRLPAAKYQLTASKRGYRTAFYDEHGEYNSAIVTGPGQNTEKLTFRLSPGGIIRGVVLTDGGEAVENARVLLFLRSHDGKPGARITQSDTASTDDTGAYEFDDLAAGEYLLAVSAEPWYALHRSAQRGRKRGSEAVGAADPSAALDVAYPVTYFDSSTDEGSATPIVITGGSRVQADINLHAVPAVRIEVDTPRKGNGSAGRAELRQMVFGTVVSAVSAGFLDAMESGSTEFTGVAPGHYELAQGDPPRVAELDATASMQVDPSLGTPTVSVHGSLKNSFGASLTDDCSLVLESSDAARHQDPIQTPCIRGGFSFSTVPAGGWLLSAESGGRPLPISSISVDGRPHRGNNLSVRDRGLSLVVSVLQAGMRVEGFARRDGNGVSGVMVVLVPSDMVNLSGMIRRDQSDSDGSFALRDVAPGQYTLVAIDDGWTLDWADPHGLQRYLPGGMPVTVSERSGKTLILPSPVPVQSR